MAAAEDALSITEISLPQTVDELKHRFGIDSNKKLVALIRDPTLLTSSQAELWKYSGAGLLEGRPLDSTIIMMSGATGAGKSTTINTLFQDSELCGTDENESATCEITLIRKSLKITKGLPAILTNLTFVDVPGDFDTNEENERRNLAYMNHFKSSQIELADRTNISWVAHMYYKYYGIPKSVYPNLVLFVWKADDNRMNGSNSALMKALKALKKSGDLIDSRSEHCNLIVVLTHVMNLPRKRFIGVLEERKEIIRKAVKDVLKIEDVKVIPVENMPEDYDLPKKGDYYQLPNGEYSHLNLFEAMDTQLHQNNDILARLSIGWYYSTECPDRKKKAEVCIVPIDINDINANEKSPKAEIDTVPTEIDDINANEKSQKAEINTVPTEIDDINANEKTQKVEESHVSSTSETSSLQSSSWESMKRICPFYNTQCISYGFCPVTEQIKSSPLKEIEEPVEMNVGSSQFLVPAGMSVFVNKTSDFHRLSFFKKEKYEEHMKYKYALDVGLQLVVSMGVEGKWSKQNRLSNSHVWVSVLYETQVAIFRLKDPYAQPKLGRFQEDLNNLPANYDDCTAKKYFHPFFCRWGTHLIHELGLGGSVQLRCKVHRNNITEDNLVDIEAEIMGVFRKAFAKSKCSFSKNVEQLRSLGVVEESLRFTGGDPPPLISLDSLTSEILEDWASSVASRPSELRHTMKLYPYYNLIAGRKSESLREATEAYLKSHAGERTEEELRQNRIADEIVEDVVEKESSNNCFPKNAQIYLANGSSDSIDRLSGSGNQTDLSILRMTGNGEKKKILGYSKTKFCTFLDAKPYKKTYYICLHFSNGKTLVVSPGHLIFEYLPCEDVVIAKQAKYFRIGEKMVCTKNIEGALVEYPAVVGISQEMCEGAYCPLTTSGTFLVDGFLVSCYANTVSFSLGQFAMAPLKIYRNIVSVERTSNGNESGKGIHPYAKFLMSVKKCYTVLQGLVTEKIR